MPDIDFQRIELNLIPKQGEQPVVFYASQYETARPFIADLMWGDTEFAPGDSCWAEIDIRKNDDNLVVITDDVTIDNNEVSVILPVQAVTCIGKNLGQVKIYAADEQLVAALNFILEVQPDPLAGGVTSDTAIDNLESQIAAIVPEVVGEDYYDKAEVDALLADKADVSDLPDMTDYYTKSQVYNKTETDALLNNKADYEDLPDMSKYYTKLETNALLSNYVETSYLTTNYYTRSDTNTIFISNSELQQALQLEGTASGSIATFETAAPAQRLAALKCNFLCSGGNGTLSTPIPLVPYTELNVTNCGVNLFDKSTISDGFWIRPDGTTDYSSTRMYSDLIRIKPNTQYYITNTIGGNDFFSTIHYDSDLNIIGAKNVGGSGDVAGTITSYNNSAYMRINSFLADLDTLMVSEGSTPLPYEPYNADTITIDLDGTRYGGYVDANNGKLVVTWGSVDLGSLDYVYSDSGFSTQLPNDAKELTSNADILNSVCDSYVIMSWNDATYNKQSGTMGTGVLRYIVIYNSDYSDAVAFKTAMSGRILAYELATPIEVDISPEYLNAHTGGNNVFHDGNGTSEVKYKDTIQHYIDERT